jgi:hypothetical protein
MQAAATSAVTALSSAEHFFWPFLQQAASEWRCRADQADLVRA